VRESKSSLRGSRNSRRYKVTEWKEHYNLKGKASEKKKTVSLTSEAMKLRYTKWSKRKTSCLEVLEKKRGGFYERLGCHRPPMTHQENYYRVRSPVDAHGKALQKGENGVSGDYILTRRRLEGGRQCETKCKEGRGTPGRQEKGGILEEVEFIIPQHQKRVRGEFEYRND